tara:strand:+ start:320 stop:499 length:180 start_codon:yes stop_codon:yes gene_type:complete
MRTVKTHIARARTFKGDDCGQKKMIIKYRGKGTKIILLTIGGHLGLSGAILECRMKKGT